MKFVPIVSVAALAAGLLASPAGWAQSGALTPQEIATNWVGKTVVGTIQAGPQRGQTIELRLKLDGLAEVSGGANDTGFWRLSDSGYCARWQTIRAGQERCFTVQRKEAGLQVINPDGSVNTVVTEVR